MSDATDFYDQQLQAAQYSLWDPKKGNVSLYDQPAGTTGQMGTQNQGVQNVGGYIQQNPNNFKGYSGGVQAIGQNRIHPEAYGFDTGTHQETQGFEGYRPSYERTVLNPYDTTSADQYGQFQRKAVMNAQVAPGVRPNVGFLGGGFGGYNMGSFRPTNWDQEYGEDFEKRNKRMGANPFETRLMNTLSRHNMRSPKYMDIQASRGSSELPDFGRGYVYEGQAGPEELAMARRLDAGQPVDFNRWDALRRTRIAQRPIGTMQKFGQKYFGPAVMGLATGIASGGAGAVLSPFASAGLGAGIGALSQGMQTKWQNPAAIGLGAAGGFAGGMAGGAGGAAMGLGPIASGALGGVGSSVGRDVGVGLANGGKFDPAQIGRNAGIAGITGGLGGAMAPGGPLPIGGGVLGKVGSSAITGAAGSALRNFVPGGPQPPRRPPTPQEVAQARERQRQLRIQQMNANPYAR